MICLKQYFSIRHDGAIFVNTSFIAFITIANILHVCTYGLTYFIYLGKYKIFSKKYIECFEENTKYFQKRVLPNEIYLKYFATKEMIT